MNLKRTLAGKTGTRDAGGVAETIKDLPLGDISIKENVRQKYEGIEELAASIKKYGLLQPITVYHAETEGEYHVKTGHRRFLAMSRLHREDPARWSRIRCIIADPGDLKIIQLVENVQREDLSQLELVQALGEMHDAGMSHQEIADALGKSEKYVRNLFSGVKEITSGSETGEKIREIMSSSPDITIQDVVTTRPLPEEERLEVLREKAEKGMTRQELRERVSGKKDSGEEKMSRRRDIPENVPEDSPEENDGSEEAGDISAPAASSTGSKATRALEDGEYVSSKRSHVLQLDCHKWYTKDGKKDGKAYIDLPEPGKNYFVFPLVGHPFIEPAELEDGEVVFAFHSYDQILGWAEIPAFK